MLIFDYFKNKVFMALCSIMTVVFIFCPGCASRSDVVHKVAPRKIEKMQNFKMPKPGKPITILVHGTRLPPPAIVAFPPLLFGVTTPSGLHKIADVNKLYYFSRMAYGLHKVAPREFPTENFYLFGWSGVLDGLDRQLAGELLYLYIKKIRSDKRLDATPITVITISHGANVALNIAGAAEKNSDVSSSVDRLVLLCGPVQDATHDYVNSPIFKNVFNIFSTGDLIQVADPQQLDDLRIKKDTFFSRRTFDTKAKNIIQTSVTLNKHTLGHLDFVFPSFYEKLPALLDTLMHHRSDLSVVDGAYAVDVAELS